MNELGVEYIRVPSGDGTSTDDSSSLSASLLGTVAVSADAGFASAGLSSALGSPTVGSSPALGTPRGSPRAQKPLPPSLAKAAASAAASSPLGAQSHTPRVPNPVWVQSRGRCGTRDFSARRRRPRRRLRPDGPTEAAGLLSRGRRGAECARDGAARRQRGEGRRRRRGQRPGARSARWPRRPPRRHLSPAAGHRRVAARQNVGRRQGRSGGARLAGPARRQPVPAARAVSVKCLGGV